MDGGEPNGDGRYEAGGCQTGRISTARAVEPHKREGSAPLGIRVLLHGLGPRLLVCPLRRSPIRSHTMRWRRLIIEIRLEPTFGIIGIPRALDAFQARGDARLVGVQGEGIAQASQGLLRLLLLLLRSVRGSGGAEEGGSGGFGTEEGGRGGRLRLTEQWG